MATEKAKGSDDFTPSEWLRIITSEAVSARQIALMEGCSVRTACKIVEKLNGGHHKFAHHKCRTDTYLATYRYTTREKELQLIYGKEKKND